MVMSRTFDRSNPLRFLFAGGITKTAGIKGISAAGTNPDVMVHTPSVDMEIVWYGKPVSTPVVPVSPPGCPTLAVITRAVRDLVPFETLVVNAGLTKQTAAPSLTLSGTPCGDRRANDPVVNAQEIVDEARSFGALLPDEEAIIGETIPGGTTIALGVLTALGEQVSVSSSLPENPLTLKRDVVDRALAVNIMAPGDAAGDPIRGSVGPEIPSSPQYEISRSDCPRAEPT